MIDCTDSEVTTNDEPPEDNTTNTDDMSNDNTSEVDMSTDCSSRKLDSDPKQTGRTWETHSYEEVVAHVNEVNGTFYGSALLDQIESFARVGNPKLLLENSAKRKRARVPLMGVVDLTRGDTATISGTSSNDRKNDVDEDVSTSEEKMCKEPSDWRSEGPGCFMSYLCSSNCPEAEAKTLMVIRAKRSRSRRKVARELHSCRTCRKRTGWVLKRS